MSVGVFLSASGARITFHAGVMDALRELGIVPDRFVGASGGSIQAVLSAAGCRGKLWFDERIPISRDNAFIRPPLLRESLKRILDETFLAEYGGHLSLDEISRRVNILSTQKFFRAACFDDFSSLEDLQLKLLASSSLPGFTTFPVKIGQKYYADGIFGYFYQRLDFRKL
nr:patatin-like phospholipase family protein [Calditrichia bacterium]